MSSCFYILLVAPDKERLLQELLDTLETDDKKVSIYINIYLELGVDLLSSRSLSLSYSVSDQIS